MERASAALAFAQVSLGTPLLRNFGPAWAAGAGVRARLGAGWLSAGLTYSQREVSDDGYPYTFRAVTATLAGGWRVGLRGPELLLGAAVSGALAHQQAADGSVGLGPIFGAGPTVGLVVPFGGRWGLRAALTGCGNTFQLNHAWVFRPSVDLALALELGL